MSELLSPAGTKEAFYAAISNGCDAIYLGIDKFNARAYANNFTIEDLKDLVKFAHLRNVRIFVTMNTILYDEELEDAFNTIDELANIHVDAIIVQDLALLNYIVNHYSSLEAHASTQVGCDDLNGAILLKQLGVTRIVFARETPLSVLKDIKSKLDVEIEAFIHGALCVSYSGNCLMSSMIGERSGNRGRCAGCCRQRYSLIDVNNDKVVKTGFLLSMKDLNTSKYIDEMDFIDSLKIEGRMKEPTYVGGVTRYYRQLLDGENPNPEDIEKVFNRTYTKGFMNGESSADSTNIERPNNNGYLIGKVAKINKDTIWVKLFKTLNKGDQIRVDSPNPFEEISIPVTKLLDANFKECESTKKVAILSCHKRVQLGALVYKTKDNEFNKAIEETFRNKEYNKKDINYEFNGKIGQKMSLKARYKDIVVSDELDFVVERSMKKNPTRENVTLHLNKLNDTPYKINKLKLNIENDSFIPLKLINELRRNVIEKIDAIRLDEKVVTREPKEIVVQPHELLAHKEITVQVSNVGQYEVAKKLGIKHIYFKNIVRRNNEHYVKPDVEEILFGGLGAIDHYKNDNVTLVGDSSLNVSNYKSAAILSSLGVDRITLSQEVNKDRINDLVKHYYEAYNTYPNLELIVYGRSFLMHSKYCPLKRLNMCGQCKEKNFALKDKFETFPLMFNEDCTTNILNAKTLNIMDDISKVDGINYYRLVFTTETKKETEKIILKFKDILDGKTNEKTFDSSSQTRGHFFKNPL